MSTSQYDRIANKFASSRSGYRWGCVLDFMKSVPEGSTVYDIGCGSGRNMCGNYKFVGLDNCASFVEMCQKNGHSVSLGNMCKLPFMDMCADYIICVAAFHHLDTPKKRMGALKEMRRILRKGGKMLLTVWSHVQPPKTKRTFDHFGDTVVPFNNEGAITNRYYYIFQLDNLVSLLLLSNFNIIKHYWDSGNEVFILN